MTPHSLRVRPAAPSDTAALAALHADATSERLGYRGGSLLTAAVSRGPDTPDVARSFILHTRVDDVEVLVVELVDGTSAGDKATGPLGHAVIRFDRAAQAVAVIEELYVSPPARTIGLGSALLEHAKEVASARGCTGIDAMTLPGDRATKNFFEDHAMVARAIIVHAELPGSAGEAPDAHND